MKYHRAFVNLDHRKDRLRHMTDQCERLGLSAIRVPGLLPSQINKPHKTGVMQRRTPGAIGCHYSQVSIMEEALKQEKHAWVMEDDLIFCEDFNERFKIMEEWMDENEWDVFWLGGTFHSPAYWHKSGHNRELPQCNCTIGRDVIPTDNPRIVRTFGCFCTYAYIVNKDSLDRVIRLLDENVHMSMGIDWLFILLQPQLKTYAFVPGSVKQMDNQSDIGNGVTMFSGFSRLNGTEENSRYWYQERMEDFDPKNHLWK